MDKARYREAGKKLAPKDAEARKEASWAICRALLAFPLFQKAHHVALFYALPWEPDLTPLWRARPQVCLYPRSEPRSRTLSFHPITSLDELRPGYAGILEPPPSPGVTEWQPGDLVLVPGTAFDTWGGRVGSGAGFYDRWLPGRPVVPIGVCFQAQVVKGKLAQEGTDARMDGLCTEAGLKYPLNS